MIRNYFLVAFRMLLKQRTYAAINIFGFGIAIAVALLIMIYVRHESTYDRFQPNYRNIYRVVTDYKFNDQLDHLALSAYPLGPALKKDYPEVQQVTQVTQVSDRKLLTRYKDKNIYQDDIYFADSNFFSLFSYPFIAGDPNTALLLPHSVVLTKSTARLFFGEEDPMGKSLEFNRGDGTFSSYKVTGVMQDLPTNTHFSFNALLSLTTLLRQYPEDIKQDWLAAFMYTYISLPEGYDISQLEAKTKDLFQRYNKPAPDNEVQAQCAFVFEPLGDIHLESKRIWGVGTGGNSQYIYIFSVVGIFILILAVINYVNLSTARGSSRMKEIGVRKVAGASRRQLIWQMMCEVLLVSLASMVFAFAMAELALPLMNKVIGIRFTSSAIFNMFTFWTGIAVAVFMALLAGFYPGIYLSRFNPAQVLKGKLNPARGRGLSARLNLRKLLVVSQFAISVVFILATAVVYLQLRFMLEKSPGFEKENVMAFLLQDTLVASKYQVMKNELEKLPSVEMVSYAATIPGGSADRKITRIEGKTPADLLEVPLQPVWSDFDYTRLMRMQLKEGNWITRDTGTGFRQAFLINETFARKYGWKQPLGKRIVFGFNPQSLRDGKVVGVVKDIYTGSFREEPEPMIFMIYQKPTAFSYVMVRSKPGMMASARAETEKFMAGFDPQHPFDPIFLDENIKKLYQAESRMSTLFITFTVISIIIACLGLIGLVSFITEQRTKEIGVRKVMGANIPQIIGMLSRDFALLAFIAIVLAIPVGWYVMHRWLEDFANRIDMSWWIFGLTALLTLCITLLAVGWQTWRAAVVNPVRSLRYE